MNSVTLKGYNAMKSEYKSFGSGMQDHFDNVLSLEDLFTIKVNIEAYYRIDIKEDEELMKNIKIDNKINDSEINDFLEGMLKFSLEDLFNSYESEFNDKPEEYENKNECDDCTYCKMSDCEIYLDREAKETKDVIEFIEGNKKILIL